MNKHQRYEERKFRILQSYGCVARIFEWNESRRRSRILIQLCKYLAQTLIDDTMLRLLKKSQIRKLSSHARQWLWRLHNFLRVVPHRWHLWFSSESSLKIGIWMLISVHSNINSLLLQCRVYAIEVIIDVNRDVVRWFYRLRCRSPQRKTVKLPITSLVSLPSIFEMLVNITVCSFTRTEKRFTFDDTL